MLREGVHNVVVCDPKWTAKLSVEKCCQVGPGYGGVEGEELATCCLALASLSPPSLLQVKAMGGASAAYHLFFTRATAYYKPEP